MINQNFKNLSDNYLFKTIGERVRTYESTHPEQRLIRMGVGDVTLPLCKAVVDAMHAAVDEMGQKQTFKGYGDYFGYPFLREAICGYYHTKGIEISPDEVFVSDGAKSDVVNILDIFGRVRVLVQNPVYPVYLDSNILAGNEVIFAECNEENNFLPAPHERADLIYICSPNNPTGAVYSHAQLSAWTAHANSTGAVIISDSAYESFITDDSPTSIFAVPDAKTCAIEIGTLSKLAGFTGTRCAYCIIPHALERCGMSLNKMWQRRQSTKFNAVPYIIQRGAAAAFSPEGLAQCRTNLAYYQANAAIIVEALRDADIWHTGGKNAPYVWMRCPKGQTSWQFFDTLLETAQVVGTPGVGFGSCGEGYFRLSAFGSREDTEEAVRRMRERI